MAKKDTEDKLAEIIKEEIKSEKKERFEIIEMTTQTAKVIKDNKSGEVLRDNDILILILNKLEKIEKNIAG